MKKVLIMAKSLGGGGSEVALIELINAMNSKEFDITLALLDKDDEYAYRLKRNINIVHIKFENAFYKSLVSMYAFPAKVLKKLGVNRYIRYYDKVINHVSTVFSDKYDLALDFYGYGYFLTAYLAKKINASKKATWVHDNKMYWLTSVDMYFKYYDKIFGVSKSVENTFRAKYPQYKEKADTFYNIINVDDIIEKSNENIETRYEGDFNILTVGRLTEQKGYDIAIKAASILKSKGIQFKWYSIGDGRDRKKLISLSQKYNVSDCFIFLGQKDNPYPYIRKCDLYVQPSRHEGYGLTILEARVLCVPIIASEIPTSKEQIKNCVNGYLTELSPESIANLIEQLYNSVDDRKKVVQQLMNEKVSFDNEIQKLNF